MKIVMDLQIQKNSKEFFDQLSNCCFSITMLSGIRWFVGSFYCFYLMKTQDVNIFHCFPEYGAPEEEEYTAQKVTLNKNLLSILSKVHTPHMF